MKKKNIIVLVSIVVFLLLFAFQQNEIQRKNSVIENYESKSRKLEKNLEDLKKAHADEIAKIKESAKASEQPKPAEQTKPTEPVKTTQEPQKPVEQPKPAQTSDQNPELRNAVKKAETYLSVMSFSKKELIDQLKYDGFNENIAAKAVESLTVDYNEQAVKKAKTYLSVMSMSKKELITQLEHDGFTKEQAAYGVNKS